MSTILSLIYLGISLLVLPVFAPDFSINSNISADVEVEILQNVNRTIEKYQLNANFWDAKLKQFDDKKYLEFIKLFAGTAHVYNDVKFNGERMHYSKYALQILNNLQEIGVPFDLQEVMINSIDIDDSGFYVIDLTITKVLFSGINQIGNPVKLKNGRKVKLNMRIDLPDYLLSDARIQYIRIQKSKSVVDCLNMPFRYISSKLNNN